MVRLVKHGRFVNIISIELATSDDDIVIHDKVKYYVIGDSQIFKEQHERGLIMDVLIVVKCSLRGALKFNKLKGYL